MSLSQKTVVITGATSFVGMHLCDAFSINRWQVIAGHTQNLANYTEIQSDRINQISYMVKFKKFDLPGTINLIAIIF